MKKMNNCDGDYLQRWGYSSDVLDAFRGVSKNDFLGASYFSKRGLNSAPILMGVSSSESGGASFTGELLKDSLRLEEKFLNFSCLVVVVVVVVVVPVVDVATDTE